MLIHQSLEVIKGNQVRIDLELYNQDNNYKLSFNYNYCVEAARFEDVSYDHDSFLIAF